VGDATYGVAVDPDGTHVYVANSSSFTVSVIEGVYTSTSTTNSASSGLPAIFLAVNGVLVGEQVEGSPVYYGTNRVAVTSTYVLTVTAVSNISPSVVTLAEGTFGADGSFSSMVRLPNLAPGTYNVRLKGEHTNGATQELTSQVTIDAGAFTSIGANIPVIR
jgi:YVTN family beta-propeller protein